MFKNGVERTKNHPPPSPRKTPGAFFGNGGGCFHSCESHEKTLATRPAIPTLLGMVNSSCIYSAPRNCFYLGDRKVAYYVFGQFNFVTEAWFEDGSALTPAEVTKFEEENGDDIREIELAP